MAFSIIDVCVNCWACHDVCPTKAIFEFKPHFLINSTKCTECQGDYADPQCASICPIEGAILNSFGDAVNAPGSLTGIALEKLEEVKAEIAAR